MECNTAHPEGVKVEMSSTAKCDQGICTRCSPPNIINRASEITVSHGGKATGRPQDNTVAFPQAIVSPGGKARSTPRRRGGGSVVSSQQRAPGRIKPQRACRRHPREAISPCSRLRRPSGPRPRGGARLAEPGFLRLTVHR